MGDNKFGDCTEFDKGFLEMLLKVLHLTALLYWPHICLFFIKKLGVIPQNSLNNMGIKEKYLHNT